MTGLAQSVERFARPLFRSPLAGVADVAWDAFVRGMSVRPVSWRGPGGQIGSFELRPRRLGEIGVMVDLRREGGRWVGDLASGWEDLGTCGTKQTRAFERGVLAHAVEVAAGAARIPDGVTLSGAFAVLHCGGRAALESWPERAFKTTRECFSRVNGIF